MGHFPHSCKFPCILFENEYNEASIEYTYERVRMRFAQQVLIASPLV